MELCDALDTTPIQNAFFFSALDPTPNTILKIPLLFLVFFAVS
jgi:hypothetical protein